MKSITIHDIDDPLYAKIQQQAKAEHRSINKTVKKVLASALGISGTNQQDRQNAFSDLCGVWDASELATFEQQTLRTIDEADWK